MTDTVSHRRRAPRILALALTAALAGAVAPIAGVAVNSAPAHAADGDVCDLCSLNFDLAACEALGGWPYDSTVEAPPPAVAGGSKPPAPPAPAPAPAAPAPAPAAPAPAPAAPAAPQTSGGGTTGGGSAPTQNEQPAAVVATAPQAPASLAHTVDGRLLTLSWAAPVDGGSPITGYKLVLNDGTPIEIPADATEFEITLGAGSYEALLIATNEVGDSEASETLSDIEIVASSASATPEPTATDAVAAGASSAAAPSPLIAVFTLGGLAVVAGALLGWWWLRRRRGLTVTPDA